MIYTPTKIRSQSSYSHNYIQRKTNIIKNNNTLQIPNNDDILMTEQYHHIVNDIPNPFYPNISVDDMNNTVINNINRIDNKISHIKRLQLAHSDTRNMIPHQISMIWCLGGRLNNNFPIKYQKTLISLLQLLQQQNRLHKTKLSLLLDHATYLKHARFFNEVSHNFGHIFEINFMEDISAPGSNIDLFVKNAQETNSLIINKNTHLAYLAQALGGNPAIAADGFRIYAILFTLKLLESELYIDFDDVEYSLLPQNIENFKTLLNNIFTQDLNNQKAISTIGDEPNNNRLFFNHKKSEELKEQIQIYMRHIDYYRGKNDKNYISPNNINFITHNTIYQRTYKAFPQICNITPFLDEQVIQSGPGFFNPELT